MTDLRLELQRTLEAVQRWEQTIPLLDGRHRTTEVGFRPLPAGLINTIAASPNYVEIVPGEEPTWLKIIVKEQVIELVVYRTIADDKFYVLGPKLPTLQ